MYFQTYSEKYIGLQAFLFSNTTHTLLLNSPTLGMNMSVYEHNVQEQNVVKRT